MNIFEYAVRNKLRFSYKGLLTVEDLWDLTLKDLDAIYKQLKGQMKVNEEESLMTSKSKADTALEMQIEIVKYIFAEKEAAQQKAINAWKQRHEETAHGLTDDNKRMKAQGVSGGRYTYLFTPTSIGTFGTIKCVCGEEYSFAEP